VSASRPITHDHLNILCLGGRTIDSCVAWELVQTFLAARFSHDERHLRRLSKVAALESVSDARRAAT
jgi:ribose 5-phosphate isomerase B